MGNRHKYRAPAHVRSAQQTRRDTRAMAQETAQAASEASQHLALLRMALTSLAGDEADTTIIHQQTQALDETRAALATLERYAPHTLAFAPDLLDSARGIVRMAEERTRALDVLPPSMRRQLMALTPDTVKGSPTHSTPVASGQDASTAWAGMGVKRTNAIGVPNANYLRRIATSDPWVQAAILHRKQQVGRADIAVVPLDETRKFDKSIQSQIERLLNYPNELRDSYRSLIEPVIDDILTLDRGCVSKDIDAKGIPHHLYAEDGATIKIIADWDGDKRKPHYVYQPPNTMEQTPLFNEQLICIMANAASYRFGLSPVQVLVDTIRADAAATKKATNLVDDVPPPQLVHLRGITPDNLKKLRAEYEREIAGQRELLFLGHGDEVKVFPLMFSLKDMQFLEWQTYLARKICAVFQISPQAIGLTFDINKATAEVQQDITEDAGIVPLLLLIEEFWNRELVADYAKVDRDGRPLIDQLNLGILFPEISEIARILHAERVLKMAAQGMAGLPILTPNTAMRMLGEEDIPGGNTLWVMTTQGPMPFLSRDGDLGYYGEFATAGFIGSQPPAGGVDEDEAAPKDMSKQKPDRGASPEQALGNESSGEGQPPDSGVQQSDTSDTQNTQQTQTKQIQAMTVSRADRRRPGVAWRPEHVRYSVPVAPHIKAARSSSGKATRPTVTAKAREKLEQRARQIFESVG